MGIENSWQKKVPGKLPQDVVQVSVAEWDRARRAIKKLITPSDGTGRKLPFKLTRAEIEQLEAGVSPNHSFFVVADEKGGYRIGAIARGKSYKSEEQQENQEGILGHGMNGVAKVVLWEDHSVDVIKIMSKREHNAADIDRELAVLVDIGKLKANLVRTLEDRKKGAPTKWIAERDISNKQYVIMPLEQGTTIQQYFQEQPDYSQLRRPYSKSSDADLARAVDDFNETIATAAEMGMVAEDAEKSLQQVKDEQGYRKKLIENKAVLLGCAKAIQQLHAKDYMHGDIKFDNFMIDTNKVPVEVSLIDYGCAHKLDGKTSKEVSVQGTPEFAPPEVFTMEFKDAKATGTPENTYSIVSKAADVHAFGVMLEKVGNAGRIGELSTEMRDMIKRMKSKNPDERPTIDQVVTFLAGLELGQSLSKQGSELVQEGDTKASLMLQTKLQGLLSSVEQPNSAVDKTMLFKLDAKTQVAMKNNIALIVQTYREILVNISSKDQEQLYNETADAIVKAMQSNQQRHNQALFSTASTYNLEQLRALPTELKTRVCQTLGIPEGSDFLTAKNITHKGRVQLASLINKTISGPQKTTEDQPLPTPPESKPK